MKFESVLNRFPRLQLCYEKIIHNKVNSDYCIAIPNGKKYFAWFTYYEDKNVCLLLEIFNKTKISKIESCVTCFHDDLALNTVVYGTLVKNKFFFVEDILYYKNKDVSLYSGKKSLELLSFVFNNEIKQVNLINKSIVFGLPIMSRYYSELVTQLNDVPYKIYCIQFRNFYGKNLKQNYLYKKQLDNVIFSLKAEVANDIYSLYCINNGKKEYYDMAYIPNYKTSVMMNNYFRQIKENNNLDALEESDDEEEFENISEDKFVNTNLELSFICEFNSKFKKWVPIKKADGSIIQRRQLFAFEKK